MIETWLEVGETKEHDFQLVQSAVGDESSFPLITFLNVDVAVSPVDVKLCEILA